MASPTAIVAYIAVFAAVGVLFLFVNLLVGYFLRPRLPNQEKLEVYECGEPVIGSSFVQFDLRFYVVALLFIIFDVEVAFFFPWATVFGKSTQLSAEAMPLVVATSAEGTAASEPRLTTAASARLREMGVMQPEGLAADAATLRETSRRIAITSLADIGVFFAVLLVGFAYVWKRGDLDWVRAVQARRATVQRAPPAAHHERTPSESILSA